MRNAIKRSIAARILAGIPFLTTVNGISAYIQHGTFAKVEYLATQLELSNMRHERGVSFTEGYTKELLGEYGDIVGNFYHKGAVKAVNEYIAGEKK